MLGSIYSIGINLICPGNPLGSFSHFGVGSGVFLIPRFHLSIFYRLDLPVNVTP